MVVATPRFHSSQQLVKRFRRHFPAELLSRPALRAAATTDISSTLWMLRSVPLGKYCRGSLLVFSFVPRCRASWIAKVDIRS
jgi:hypothetical protein